MPEGWTQNGISTGRARLENENQDQDIPLPPSLLFLLLVIHVPLPFTQQVWVGIHSQNINCTIYLYLSSPCTYTGGAVPLFLTFLSPPVAVQREIDFFLLS